MSMRLYLKTSAEKRFSHFVKGMYVCRFLVLNATTQNDSSSADVPTLVQDKRGNKLPFPSLICTCFNSNTSNIYRMKIKWPVVVFLIAFALVQFCMFVAWQRLSSEALLCNVVSSIPLASFTDSRRNEIKPSHNDQDNEKRLDLNELKEIGVKPRAFAKWSNDTDFPCFPPDDKWWHPLVLRSPAHEGLLFVKEMKTGSSTMAGVTIRIARNVGRRLFGKKFRLCKLRFDHTSASKLDYGNRNKKKSFLFTVIREPTSRAISQFFHFHVSREKVEPSDANFQHTLLKYPYLDHYYLRDLSMKRFIPRINDTITVVNDILSEYNFIGITERLDESLVALQMILGLETNDLLYLKAKGNGGYDDAATQNRTCTYIVPSFLSPGMKDFFASQEWNNRIAGDTLLYNAADASLDLTINQLGREEFNTKLQSFRETLALAEKTCTNVRFPCSESGQINNRTDCLWLDSGCGVHCLDKIQTPTT
jgi:hypothetical protein